MGGGAGAGHRAKVVKEGSGLRVLLAVETDEVGGPIWKSKK
jgi:hypothetical protein